MSKVYKAQRRVVQIGDIPLEVAMLPDGSYCLSQMQVSAVIEKPEISIRRFRQTKRLEALLGKASQFDTLTVEGANKPIVPVTPELAGLYWYKCAAQGNKKAQALVIALLKCSLYDIADRAFGIERRSQQRDRFLTDDLSDTGIARIEALRQNLVEQQPLEHELETQTERELKLKIQLVQLELERQKLELEKNRNPFPATEINKVGASPWQVIPWMQKTLGWANSADASRLLYQLGYGYRTEHWFKLRILGELWV
ncbi:hypothetical protein C7B79_29360, partial [Chroococcidiopsis cubana CCALA 043]